MVLALESGISPTMWAAEGDRVVFTALDILAERGGEQRAGRVVARSD